MTDPEGLALLAAVCARPADDAPRWVYADWLDEHGSPARAEFIRVQCELAGHPCGVVSASSTHAPSPTNGPCRGCERVSALRRRERELLDGFNRDKVDCCPRAFPGVRLVGLDLDWYRGNNLLGVPSRGFLGQVIGPAADWLAHADALTWHPAAADPCSKCKGGQIPRWVTFPCDICQGMAPYTIPRPVPPTAQPVTRVVLTTFPDVMEMYRLGEKHGMGGSPGNRISHWENILAAEWPAIAFALPDLVPA